MFIKLKIYIDVFITGVALGWGPCLWFCAPILLPYIAATQKGWFEGLKITLAFSFARIVPYAILSLISATLGPYLIKRFYEDKEGLIIYISAGALISLLGIIILLGKAQALYCWIPFRKFNAQGVKEMVLLGLMVGFAPCIPLLGLLAYVAFNAQNSLHGATLGLTFGMGTVVSPLILFGPLAGGAAGLLLKKPLIHKIFSRACGLILVYLGMGMVFGAL